MKLHIFCWISFPPLYTFHCILLLIFVSLLISWLNIVEMMTSKFGLIKDQWEEALIVRCWWLVKKTDKISVRTRDCPLQLCYQLYLLISVEHSALLLTGLLSSQINNYLLLSNFRHSMFNPLLLLVQLFVVQLFYLWLLLTSSYFALQLFAI